MIQATTAHYESVWGPSERFQWDRGPMVVENPSFSVLRFRPNGSWPFWTYATNGMSQAMDESIELHLFSKEEALELVELLTIVAHYHATGARLGLHHTVNFGRPWLERSSCEYGYVSLPYMHGEPLELSPRHPGTRFLWLVPVAYEEVELKKNHGVDALEELFERRGFDYADRLRPSVA